MTAATHSRHQTFICIHLSAVNIAVTWHSGGVRQARVSMQHTSCHVGTMYFHYIQATVQYGFTARNRHEFYSCGVHPVAYVYIASLNIHLQSHWQFLWTYSSLFHSQHASALSGHPQVNHNILYLVTHLQKIRKTDPLRQRQFSVDVWLNIIYCDSPEDGPKGPRHVVSEIVKNTSIKTVSCDCRLCLIKLYRHEFITELSVH
jgi:hypothetical protein